MTFEVIEATLATGEVSEQAKLEVAGFRTHKKKNYYNPQNLFMRKLKRFGHFHILENTQCVNFLRGIFAFNEKQMCTEMQDVNAAFVSIHTKLI